MSEIPPDPQSLDYKSKRLGFGCFLIWFQELEVEEEGEEEDPDEDDEEESVEEEEVCEDHTLHKCGVPSIGWMGGHS